jgi:MerR family transcriptional regulator/heat shock protein HspR
MKNPDKNIPQYSIAAVAEMLDVSVETLRLYERRGLILIYKSKGNQRIYSQADVERFECIRRAINEHKISIEGIRRMQAMIPCWEYVQCSTAQRNACPAYNRPDAGCWTYKHKRNACKDRECKTCPVYQLSADCEKIKAAIHHRPPLFSD